MIRIMFVVGAFFALIACSHKFAAYQAPKTPPKPITPPGPGAKDLPTGPIGTTWQSVTITIVDIDKLHQIDASKGSSVLVGGEVLTSTEAQTLAKDNPSTVVCQFDGGAATGQDDSPVLNITSFAEKPGPDQNSHVASFGLINHTATNALASLTCTRYSNPKASITWEEVETAVDSVLSIEK